MLMKTRKITHCTQSLSLTLLLSLALTLFIPLSSLNAQTVNKKVEKTEKNSKTKPTIRKGSQPNDQKTKPIVVSKPVPKPIVVTPILRDSIKIGTGETAVNIPVEPVVENLPKGKVDWTNQYIESKGQSVIDNVRFKNPAQAKLMAKRGAIVDAQRNLLETTKGVQVTSETKVQDMITTSDYIYSRVDGLVKNATLVGEAIEKDGYMEVTMRIPLYDQKGLAPVLYDQVVKKMSTTSTIKPITSEPQNTEDTTNISEITDISKLAFNLNGKTYDPSMFPVVLDEKGNVVLDYSKIYDPKKGVFPKVVSAGKSLLEAFGAKKGVEVLNVLQSADGKITVDTSKVKNKINWAKIGSIATTIGKFALALVL